MSQILTYYLHHAGGLPVVPHNLAGRAGCKDTRVVPLVYAETGTTIEQFAATARQLVASHNSEFEHRGAVLYGHSMGGLAAYELCRQLPLGDDLGISHVVIAAAAPWWLSPPNCDAENRLDVGQVSASNERLRLHLEAVRCYSPAATEKPLLTPTTVLYNQNDKLAPSAIVHRWERTSIRQLKFVRLQGKTHLFHTDRSDRSLTVTWQSLFSGTPQVLSAGIGDRRG